MGRSSLAVTHVVLVRLVPYLRMIPRIPSVTYSGKWMKMDKNGGYCLHIDHFQHNADGHFFCWMSRPDAAATFVRFAKSLRNPFESTRRMEVFESHSAISKKDRSGRVCKICAEPTPSQKDQKGLCILALCRTVFQRRT